MKLFKNYQLLEFLQQNYPKIRTIKKITQIEHKNINSINYLIVSTKTNYVLRNYIDNSNSKKIENVCRILNYCIQKNAKVSKSIKNKNNLFVNQKNKLYLTDKPRLGLYGKHTSMHRIYTFQSPTERHKDCV